MSLAFLALSPSSSVRRSLIGSVCFFTHFLRAQGFTRPQNPSLPGVIAGVAEGCCSIVEEGVFCGGGVCCASCASAGTPTADARRSMPKVLDNGFELFDRFIIGFCVLAGGVLRKPIEYAR